MYCIFIEVIFDLISFEDFVSCRVEVVLVGLERDLQMIPKLASLKPTLCQGLLVFEKVYQIVAMLSQVIFRGAALDSHVDFMGESARQKLRYCFVHDRRALVIHVESIVFQAQELHIFCKPPPLIIF